MESRPAGLVAPADVDEGQRGRGEDGVSSVNRVVFIFSVVFCPPPHGHHLLPDHVGCRSVEHVEGQFCRLDRELFIETCHSVYQTNRMSSNTQNYATVMGLKYQRMVPGTDSPGAPERGRTGWNPDSGFTPAGSKPRPRVVSGLS